MVYRLFEQISPYSDRISEFTDLNYAISKALESPFNNYIIEFDEDNNPIEQYYVNREDKKVRVVKQ